MRGVRCDTVRCHISVMFIIGLMIVTIMITQTLDGVAAPQLSRCIPARFYQLPCDRVRVHFLHTDSE